MLAAMSMESRPSYNRDGDDGEVLRRLSLLLVEAERLAAALAMDFAALRIEEVATMVHERTADGLRADDWSGITLFH